MAHFPDDDNFDEFMNASSEEWSKPQTPPDKPSPRPSNTDRWGSPLPESRADSDQQRWGSEQAGRRPSEPQISGKQAGKRPWWIIAIIVAAVICLCACVLVFGLPMLGVTLFAI